MYKFVSSHLHLTVCKRAGAFNYHQYNQNRLYMKVRNGFSYEIICINYASNTEYWYPNGTHTPPNFRTSRVMEVWKCILLGPNNIPLKIVLITNLCAGVDTRLNIYHKYMM